MTAQVAQNTLNCSRTVAAVTAYNKICKFVAGRETYRRGGDIALALCSARELMYTCKLDRVQANKQGPMITCANVLTRGRVELLTCTDFPNNASRNASSIISLVSSPRLATRCSIRPHGSIKYLFSRRFIWMPLVH